MSYRLFGRLHSVAFTLLLCGAFLLSACGEEDALVLPEGVQTLTGTILPTDISLFRRGTHLFAMNGEDVYFLESTTVNLRKYEQKRVVLEGMVSANVTEEYLPLLTVDSIIDVLEQATKGWRLRSFELTFELPDSWGGSIETDSSVFIPLGAEQPVITFVWGEVKETEEESEEGSLDYNSVPIIVDDLRATKIVDDDTGNETVRVARSSGVIEISYKALDHPHAQQWHEDWIALLDSIEFDATRIIDQPTSTGTIIGSPCGGAAGILCSEGFYCDVVNLQENIGVCKSL